VYVSIEAHPAHLIGRQRELRRIREVVGRIRDQGGVLVVRGEAGIGKSALLAEAGRIAADNKIRVLATTGVQSEAQVPFAGLHRLLRPVLGHVDRLPRRQREALASAFGEIEADVPDLFLVALAALGLVSEFAAEAPILLIVEDAHWLDGATAEALTFVARRLEFEPVVLLAGLTDGYPCALDAGLPELRLERLADDAAAALLAASAPDLPPATRDRVLREAVGNPLALVELPAVLRRDGDTAAVTSWLSLTTRLEHAFADRVDGLPAATRTVLTAAALDDGDGLGEILDAAAVLDGGRPGLDSLAPAVRARLVEVDDDRLRFTHPLMRSAIYRRAGAGDRQRAHAAFARVVLDEDRRVWHRAASLDGPDEQVASEMEAAALRAHRRAGTMTAVAALERAARLSDTPVRRGDRLLRAAEYAFELGRHEVVTELLGQAEQLALTPHQRWRLAWIRDSFDDGVVTRGMGAGSLVTVAERAADNDPGLALKLLHGAAVRGWWTSLRPEVSAQIVAAAERLPAGVDDARLLATLAFAAPTDRGAVVIERLAEAGDDAHASRLLGVAAMAVGALDIAMGLLARAVADLRAQGRLGLLARALAVQAWTAALVADVDVAVPAADEARRLARETSQPVIGATAATARALLAAIRDEQDVADAFAEEAERVAAPAGARCLLAGAQLARGMAALGAGRIDAYDSLSRLFDPADLAYHPAIRCFAVGDLVEAAVRAGRTGAVARTMAQMEASARTTPSPALHQGLRHARALLASDEALYTAALTSDSEIWPFHRARGQLAYGEWLRRERRAVESRAHLRAARETFDALGAAGWADRARQELRASGETSRHRVPQARDGLTPQELQIALMAADGLTNREIGQRLYLSHRTIGSHLHRLFPKLGIASRAQLRTALQSAE
jgi:DNA-binding CsgD family transcriptional regulator